MNIQKVLLTTDLSEESERPYQAVADLARRVGASVQLLHVVGDLVVAAHGAPLAPPQHSPDLHKRIQAAKEELAGHAEKLGPGLEVETQVISASSIGSAIAEHAVKNNFDLLAISTHGRSGFRRLVMGSVAEHVLRHAKTPVLVFPRVE